MSILRRREDKKSKIPSVSVCDDGTEVVDVWHVCTCVWGSGHALIVVLSVVELLSAEYTLYLVWDGGVRIVSGWCEYGMKKGKRWYTPKVRANFVASSGKKRGSGPARHVDDLLVGCHLSHLNRVDGPHCMNGEAVGAGVFEYAEELVGEKGCGEGKDGSRALLECDIARRVRAGNGGEARTRKVLGEVGDTGVELCRLCGGVWRVHVQGEGTSTGETRRGTTTEKGNHDGPRLGLGLRWLRLFFAS